MKYRILPCILDKPQIYNLFHTKILYEQIKKKKGGWVGWGRFSLHRKLLHWGFKAGNNKSRLWHLSVGLRARTHTQNKTHWLTHCHCSNYVTSIFVMYRLFPHNFSFRFLTFCKYIYTNESIAPNLVLSLDIYNLELITKNFFLNFP